MSTCFVCGKAATTEEHIFPKWLQNKYQLWEQTIGLPNETKIKYRQLKIPCCAPCNNIILSSIETRIRDSTASIEDIWKWGAKIHFGLARKDEFLDWDRKNPGYKIGEVIKAEDPLELDRHLVHCLHGEFHTHPSPFGSVYVFNFDAEQPYHFVHLVHPIAALCICLGKMGYVIFIKDTGTLVRQPSIQAKFADESSNSHLGKMLNFFANAIAHLVRYRTTFPIMMSTNSIAILGRPKLIEEVPFTDEMFHALWRYVTANPHAPIVDNHEYKATNGLPRGSAPNI